MNFFPKVWDHFGSQKHEKTPILPIFGAKWWGGFVFNEVTAYLMLYRKFPITHEIFNVFSSTVGAFSIYLYLHRNMICHAIFSLQSHLYT